MLRDWFRRGVEQPLAHVTGGTRRLKVITLLACVLALDAADKATVGAVAAELQKSLHIDNVEIGWLVSASTAVAAFMTLPFGALADHVKRTRLLVYAIVAWSVAMVVAGASVSYVMLLFSRLGLGLVAAAAAPVVMSLTGDFFQPHERGRVLGYIFAGELLGIAFGFLVSGNLAAVLSWRASFWVLAAAGAALAVVIWRKLEEPERGGHGQLPLENRPKRGQQGESGSAYDEHMAQELEHQGTKPVRPKILREDPARMSVWSAARYILTIPTYRTMILATALGYFYFTGLRTFAIVYVRAHFGLGQAVASSVSVAIGLGAIVGVLIAGRTGDALIGRGHLTGRVVVGGTAYLVAVVALIPAFLIGNLYFAAPLFFVAAAGIGGANPVVNAARLDIMHWGLWGRAEGVFASLRYLLEAAAPPLFGWISSWFGTSGSPFGGNQPTNARGLQITFLVTLLALAGSGLVLLLRSRKTYERDVATAIASEHCGGEGRGEKGEGRA